MNSKKAKALRQLTKHMQNRGVIENKDWVVVGSAGTNTSTRMLDPSCGKSMYKQMKKRAQLTGKA